MTRASLRRVQRAQAAEAGRSPHVHFLCADCWRRRNPGRPFDHRSSWAETCCACGARSYRTIWQHGEAGEFPICRGEHAR